jgi:hypothetical protein
VGMRQSNVNDDGVDRQRFYALGRKTTKRTPTKQAAIPVTPLPLVRDAEK